MNEIQNQKPTDGITIASNPGSSSGAHPLDNGLPKNQPRTYTFVWGKDKCERDAILEVTVSYHLLDETIRHTKSKKLERDFSKKFNNNMMLLVHGLVQNRLSGKLLVEKGA